MAKNFTVNFQILGNLDDSLLKALQTAASKVEGLKKLSGSVNAKSIRQAKQLQNAQKALNQVQNYKELQKALNDNIKAQATLRADNQKQIADYQKAQKAAKQLGDTLTDLKNKRAAVQKNQADARAEIKNLQAQQKLLRSQIKNAPPEFKSNLKQQLASNKKALADQRQALQSARNELQNLNGQIKQTNASFKAQNQLVNNFRDASGKSSKTISDLQAQIHQQQQQLSNLRIKIPSGNITAAESALRAQIQSTTDALNREIAAIERRNQLLNNFNQSQQNLSNAYSNFQNSIDTAQNIMNPFKEAADNAMTFEKAMSKVEALTQMRHLKDGNVAVAKAEKAALEALAIRLGATTEFTPTEVADAMGYLGMAGWDYERITSSMSSILDLASVVGDHNIPGTADIFSDLMTAMSLKPGEMIQVGDKMVEASKHFGDATSYALTQSNMDKRNYFEALKYSAPIAATAGLSVGEEIAANMIVASSGLKGSMAGTGMRSGLLTLAGANKKAQAALEEVGVSSSDAQKQIAEAESTMNSLGVTGKTFSDRIMQLGQAFSTMGADEKLTNAYKIFGKNAATFWTKLLSDPQSLMDFAKYSKEIDSGYADDWAADTAKVMRDNTQTEIEYLKSAADVLQLNIGNALLPSIREAAQAITPLVAKLAEWVSKNQEAVKAAALLAAAISAVVVAGAGLALLASFGKFVVSGFMLAANAVRGFATVLGLVKGAFMAARTAAMGFGIISAAASAIAAAPIWLIVGAVAVLIGIIGYATGAFDGLGDALANAWNHPQGAVEGFTQLVRSKMEDVVNYVMDRWNTMKSALEHPIDAVINFLDHGDVIGGKVVSGESQRQQAAIAQSQQHYQSVGGGISAVQNQIVELDTSQAQSQIDSLGQAAQIAGQTFSGYQTAALNFSDKLSDVENAEIDTAAIQAALDAMGDAASNAAVNMDGINQVSTDLDGVNQAAQNIATNLSNVDNAALNTATNLSNVDNAALNTATNLSNVDNAALNLSTNLSNVDNAALNLSTNLSNVDTAAQTSAQELINASTEFMTSGQNAITAGESMLQAGNSALGAVASFDALTGAVSAVAGALSAKAAEIGAIVIRQPQIQTYTVSVPVGAPVQNHNATGGIYPRGAFTTWFAEDSPEAAIPINNSARSLNLWEQTGRMLGVEPQTHSFYNETSPINISISVNVAGNANEETVRRGIEQSLPRVKSFAEELAAYNHERARRSYL